MPLRIALGFALVASLGLLATTASARSDVAAADAQVAVLLPDSKSSVRWETQDRRFLAAAFKAAGVTYSIVNAEGDAQKQRSQAEQALTNGAKVILLVNLDSGSGAAIESLAAARGAKTIDYDRLTLKGRAAYYVSFNNVAVGRLQGQGLVSCLKASGTYSKKPVIAQLHGSPTDNNATLFRQGYQSVLNPLFKNGTFKKGPDQAVPAWDNQKALTIFEQMLARTSNKIDGVAAANDGLGNAAISALKARKLKQIPVTGQDATAQGVQNVIAGDQCMTVYKAIKAEANAAAKLAISLVKGTKPVGVNGKTFDGRRQVPSVLLVPVAITKKNYKILFTDGFLKRSEVCRGAYAKFCN
ncbi:MAG: substrate-binding domain-containing protein [Actinobacteria bacterium]|nr:substrate-binding domain-containing protein [Actinomycetota bacterium]